MKKLPIYGALGKQALELEVYKSFKDIGEVIIDGKRTKVVLGTSKLDKIAEYADNEPFYREYNFE